MARSARRGAAQRGRAAGGAGRALRARLVAVSRLGRCSGLVATAALAGACFQDVPLDPSASTTSAGSGATKGSTSEETAGSTGETGALDPPTAFRITSLEIVDPHLYFMLDGMTCSDITELVNGIGLPENLKNNALNLVLLVHPLDVNVAAPTLRISEAKCNDGLDTCADVTGTPIAKTGAENRLEGVCDGVVEGSRSAAYVEPPLAVSAAPCLVSAPTEFEFRIDPDITRLPLRHMVVTASYEEGEAGARLVNGTIRGWMSDAECASVAGTITIYPFNLWETVAGGAGCQPEGVEIDDTDVLDLGAAKEDGLWFYLNFTAEEITWLE